MTEATTNKTRTQLKQLWKLKSAAVVDEIAIACFGQAHKQYTEQEQTGMYQVLQIMQSQTCSAADALKLIGTSEPEDVIYGDNDENLNTAFSDGMAGSISNQRQIAEMTLPAVVEGAIQLQEVFWTGVASLSNHPQITESPRVVAARNTAKNALIAPFVGKGATAVARHFKLLCQDNKVKELSHGDGATLLTNVALLPVSTQ